MDDPLLFSSDWGGPGLSIAVAPWGGQSGNVEYLPDRGTVDRIDLVDP